MINTFKIISWLEGVSYLALLFVGVPFKYFMENDSIVKALGMPHGILFMAYCVLAIYIRDIMKWDMKTLGIVLIASVLPFGTFYINNKYFKR